MLLPFDKSEAMEKPSTSSKRPREEEKEGGVEQSADSSSYLQNFLEYNTDKLAAVGRHDVKVIADLESFCGKLQASIAAVKKARDDEEKARTQKEKAIQDEIDKKAREEQNKIDEQAREEKTKIRKQLVAEKRCFQCKAVDKGLTHGGGESGDGVIFCDDCYEIVGTRSCPSCSSFFHKSLGEDSCCKVDCMDDCYTCKSCKEIWCLLVLRLMVHFLGDIASVIHGTAMTVRMIISKETAATSVIRKRNIAKSVHITKVWKSVKENARICSVMIVSVA